MRILLDQDEVLAKWNARILEWFNQDEGTAWREEDIVDAWEMEKTLGPTAKHFIRSCMRWPEFYTNLDPVEGAIDGVKKLMDDGHDVIIVSSVPKQAGIAYHGKLQWLREKMPFFPLDNFIAAKRKTLVIGDVLLDDGPHNIEDFVKAGRDVVIMDRPHNRKIKGPHRIRHWNEFLEYIDDVKAKYDK